MILPEQKGIRLRVGEFTVVTAAPAPASPTYGAPVWTTDNVNMLLVEDFIAGQAKITGALLGSCFLIVTIDGYTYRNRVDVVPPGPDSISLTYTTPQTV